MKIALTIVKANIQEIAAQQEVIMQHLQQAMTQAQEDQAATIRIIVPAIMQLTVEMGKAQVCMGNLALTTPELTRHRTKATPM
jgi:uncharacterized protein YqeY